MSYHLQINEQANKQIVLLRFLCQKLYLHSTSANRTHTALQGEHKTADRSKFM